MNLKIKKYKMHDLIKALFSEGYKVVGVKKKENQYIFDIINKPSSFTIDYLPTLLPIKKFFLPQKEKLFDYDKQTQSFCAVDETKLLSKSTVYLGLRACDLESLSILDDLMLKDNTDTNFQNRRKNSLLFAFDCEELIDENCFCDMLNKKNYSMADAVFYDRGDAYLIEARSTQARRILENIENVFTPSDERIDSCDIQFKESGHLLEKAEELSDVNKIQMACEKEAKNCFECGVCVMVCPTCGCFSIYDEDEINMSKGQRVRAWDGCMLKDFSLVAGEHRMVKSGTDRALHRFNRKYKNALKNQNRFLCVGCGRCSRACPAGNDIKNILGEICFGGRNENE